MPLRLEARVWVILVAGAAALAGLAARRADVAFIDSNLAAAPATQVGGGGCYPVSIAPSLLDMFRQPSTSPRERAAESTAP